MNSGERIYKTTCRGCASGCSALVHMRDDRVVKVEGAPDSPVNRGWMCSLGKANTARYYVGAMKRRTA